MNIEFDSPKIVRGLRAEMGGSGPMATDLFHA